MLCASDEFDSGDSSDAASDNEESRPQTKNELMSRAMRSVVKRESAMRKQDHFDLNDVPDRGSKKDRGGGHHHKQQKAIKA